ncbi:hypothetical protein AB4Z10_13385 [Bosea sp. RAF48]|uniref:hypothetical protein n=1 Tax=Bosea sp. RAF48 TaxID=3237480 RepID=UPI003F903415
MVDLPEGKVVAPFVGTVAEGKSGPSFSGYFLRDLHQQGRLNADIVKRVVDEQGTASTFEEIMAAVTDITGVSVSEKLARDLDTVAAIGSQMN